MQGDKVRYAFLVERCGIALSAFCKSRKTVELADASAQVVGCAPKATVRGNRRMNGLLLFFLCFSQGYISSRVIK